MKSFGLISSLNPLFKRKEEVRKRGGGLGGEKKEGEDDFFFRTSLYVGL